MNENYFELEFVVNNRIIVAVGSDLGELEDDVFGTLNAFINTASNKWESLITSKDVLEEQKWVVDNLREISITDLDEDGYKELKAKYPTETFNQAMDNLVPIIYLTTFKEISESVPNNKVRISIDPTTKEITVNMHNYFYLVAGLSFVGTDKDLIRGEIETEPYHTTDFFDEIDFNNMTVSKVRSFAKVFEPHSGHSIVLKQYDGYHLFC